MCTPASEDMDSLLSGCGLSLRESSDEDREEGVFSGIKRATRKATTTVHDPSRKGGPGISARWDQDRRKKLSLTFTSHRIAAVTEPAYLSGTVQGQGVNVVFSLDGVHGVDVDVEEEEDEAVQSRPQTVTQTSDPRDHALDDTCRARGRVVNRKLLQGALSSRNAALGEARRHR